MRAEVFDALDRGDAQAWADHLAPDAVMRFASEDPIYGRAACREQALSLLASVTSLSYELLDQWEHGDATITEAAVTVALHDGNDVTIPTVTIYRTNTRGKIADYRVYLDPAPAWA